MRVRCRLQKLASAGVTPEISWVLVNAAVALNSPAWLKAALDVNSWRTGIAVSLIMPKRAREEPCAICGHWHDVS